MFKQISKIVCCLFFVSTSFITFAGTSFSNLQPFSIFFKNKLLQIKNHSLSGGVGYKLLTSDDYANFSGDWDGQCYLEGKEKSIEEPLRFPLNIENDANKIKICSEYTKCSEFEIGRDLGDHIEIDNGFIDYHYALRWIDKSSLVLVMTELNLQQEDQIQSLLGRVIFSKEQEKLVLRIEHNYIINADESNNSKYVCKLERQN